MSQWLVVLMAGCLGMGCAGYRVGPTNGMAAGARSVEVQIFKNETREPRLGEALATALRKGLQQDGTFRLATRREGDIIVQGAIRNYDRSALTYQPRDTLSTRDYELALVAQVQAVERVGGKVLLDREVRGRTTVRLLSDQSSTERQALPLLADDLARNITSLLVEGGW
jgi:hypothetical protein